MTEGGYSPGRSNIEWSIWRPVTAKIATLAEIETHWSIDDLADANEALDIKAEAEEFAARQARKGR